MTHLTRTFVLLIGLVFFGLSCNEATTSQETTIVGLSAAELQKIAEDHISEELVQLGQPVLQEFSIRDTMFIKEFYEREKIIYSRNLEKKDYRLAQAIQQANDAYALLLEQPDNTEAKASYENAQERVFNIENSQVLVDSFTTIIQNTTGDPVKYYEVVLSYEGTDSDGKAINFLARINAEGEVEQAGRTRINAGKSKKKTPKKG